MWVARGLPRVVKRENDEDVVGFSALGHWKVDVTSTYIQLRCMHHKDAPPYRPHRLSRQTGSTPLACAFLPHADTSRIVVLTSTTLEMYSYALDLTDGVRLHAHESIAFGKDGDTEVGRCLAVNEDHIFVGTSTARIMVFRWAFMGHGGVVVSPLLVENSSNSPYTTTSDAASIQCTSIACNLSFQLSSHVVVAVTLSNGKCVLVTLASPAESSGALHFQSVERVPPPPASALFSAVAMDAGAGLLAVGATDSTVRVFRLHHPKKAAPRRSASSMVDLPGLLQSEGNMHVQLLSLGSWGYSSDELGHVSSLAFTEDGRAVAIGYAHRGFSVFSTDGCKLMSSLPQQLGDVSHNEIAAYGVERVSWTYATTSLVIIPNRFCAPAKPVEVASSRDPPLCHMVDVQLVKDADGLCLSLAGEPNQTGAWVRPEAPFVPRQSTGGPGPAQLCTKLHGGELLLSIDGVSVWQSPFDAIVHQLQAIPAGSTVALAFLKVSSKQVFPLAVAAIESFRESDKLLVWTADHSIYEYSLRMQALYGDCPVASAPSSLVDSDAHAKFNGWTALRECSKDVAMHRYIKLYLSLFPTIHPQQALENLVQPDASSVESNEVVTSTAVVLLLDFARSVLPLDRSALHLVESDAVVMVATQSCNDPCGVLSSATVPVPSAYAQANRPLQHVAVNAADSRLIVAGTRGFVLFNKRTSKWLLFGSELEEQSFAVVAMAWWRDDAIVALVRTTTASQLFLDVFPRNRLDLDSRKAHIAISDNVYAVTVDDNAVYCLSTSKLWVYRITSSGTVESSTDAFQLSLQLCRTEPLPLCNAIQGHARCLRAIPRLTRRSGHSVESSSWFGGAVWSSLFSDSTNQWTLPRFLVLDQVNDAYLWDPETKIQTLVANDITQISHVSPPEWPLVCSHVVGLYGRHGYRVWWPFLDGIAFAPPVDHDIVLQFLQANDPLRAKYIATSHANALTWDAYVGLLAEYGVHVQHGSESAVTPSSTLSSMLVDPLLRFNPEVQILGILPDFGVLVGAFQENYTGVLDLSCRVQPFVHTTVCNLLLHHQTDLAAAILKAMPRQCALTTLTLELVLVAILDKCFESKWSVAVLEMALTLLQKTDQDMETYCEIVANVARKVEPNRLPLLFPLAGDPTQLLQLCRQRNEVRTAANFLLCLDESPVATESSKHMIRPRTNSYAQFQSRSALAFELLVDCCEKDQLPLALQVVRVARAWEPDHYRSHTKDNQQYDRFIDEQVGKYAFQMLVQHRFDKVVWLLTQVEATLPTLHGQELGITDKNIPIIQTRLLALLSQAQMRKLHAGVVAARYEQWAALIKNLLEQSPAKFNRQQPTTTQ
ncbi:hypothetical protein, variant 2 [Aphanomyces astaci]|uniref:ACB domain-containing protein n=1 Tax=Aphanomyces astaci TaxID=112090 RepID=W4GEX6_APHAT|nr:hypothetical protein, variant 1 [Aphanomyces astaci]XP_009832706.1 hypothetical protein, variant 2 [Aphanomyces astaci]ETV77594.1 hypothetical protein, variant 1 [Aphanomyces astaci]ETV77595.1 hypothetical protein, variant 2 [Aphanomyces astaci]|eukprot:XP_009832705.1 hypothetical protein, variant 1 [Aphanomyces astaci]